MSGDRRPAGPRLAICQRIPADPLPYRVDWWLPLRRSPGEWAGSWDMARDPIEARDIAFEAIRRGAALSQVRLTALGPGGNPLGCVVVDGAGLSQWSLILGSLPPAHCDQNGLPPLGREGMVHRVISRCRSALSEACSAGLVDTFLVAAVVEIVDQAFSGVGPAIELAAAMQGRTRPEDLA